MRFISQKTLALTSLKSHVDLYFLRSHLNILSPYKEQDSKATRRFQFGLNKILVQATNPWHHFV